MLGDNPNKGCKGDLMDGRGTGVDDKKNKKESWGKEGDSVILNVP